MKMYVFLTFVLGCITMVTCECSWSGCEGLLKLGSSICSYYGTGTYTGQTYKEGCSLDTTRVLCCKPQNPNCGIWSNKCYGTGYGGNYVCQTEFGGNYLATGKEQGCPNAVLGFKYECCPV